MAEKRTRRRFTVKLKTQAVKLPPSEAKGLPEVAIGLGLNTWRTEQLPSRSGLSGAAIRSGHYAATRSSSRSLAWSWKLRWQDRAPSRRRPDEAPPGGNPNL
jgi:hypothetical protein